VIGFIKDERGTAGVAFLSEGGELLCGCGALVRIAINRNGQSQCVECDARIVGDPRPSQQTLVDIIIRQRDFSVKTFGPGPRTKGLQQHIRKELEEIDRAPLDVEEWIDIVILALDGAWRAGFTPAEVVRVLTAKQSKNERRSWPDWRQASQDQAIEHDRSGER